MMTAALREVVLRYDIEMMGWSELRHGKGYRRDAGWTDAERACTRGALRDVMLFDRIVGPWRLMLDQRVVSFSVMFLLALEWFGTERSVQDRVDISP